MIYGYASQKKNMQVLKSSGILEENIYNVKDELLNIVKSQDIIVFLNIDELGKSFKEIKDTFEFLTEKRIVLQFLEQPILNTSEEVKNTSEIVSFFFNYFAEKEANKKKDRQKETYAILPRDERGRILSIKTNKPVGRKNAYDNLTSIQENAVKNFHEGTISLKQCIEITGFSRATIYKLKKLLFPENEDISKKEIIYSWINKNITLEECMVRTGFCRSYLYILKKKYVEEEQKDFTKILLPKDEIFYPVEYLNGNSDFSKFQKFGKIVKFTLEPREEYIDYSYGYDKYSDITEVYKIEKLNKSSIWFCNEKFISRDFKYKDEIFIYYDSITSKRNLDNEVKNKIIFYFSKIEMKYKKYHLKCLKSPLLKHTFKEYLNSLSRDERIDLFIRTKSKIFLNTVLKEENKDILESELKEIYSL